MAKVGTGKETGNEWLRKRDKFNGKLELKNKKKSKLKSILDMLEAARVGPLKCKLANNCDRVLIKPGKGGRKATENQSVPNQICFWEISEIWWLTGALLGGSGCGLKRSIAQQVRDNGGPRNHRVQQFNHE